MSVERVILIFPLVWIVAAVVLGAAAEMSWWSAALLGYPVAMVVTLAGFILVDSLDIPVGVAVRHLPGNNAPSKRHPDK